MEPPPSGSTNPTNRLSKGDEETFRFSIDSRLGRLSRYGSGMGLMSPLEPPTAPFAHDQRLASTSRTEPPSGLGVGEDSASTSRMSHSRSGSASNIAMLSAPPSSGFESSNVSLSINYLPSKFSSRMLSKQLDEKDVVTRRRKANRNYKGFERRLKIPKMGGGVQAFKAGEARIGTGDAGYRATGKGGLSRLNKLLRSARSRSGTMRWNRFKATLFVANATLTFYSFASFVVCLLLWFDAWTYVDVIRVGNRAELVISTLAASMGLFTCLVGWAGTLTNNRRFLSVYNLLLWITFIFLVLPGYITYKRRTFNLEGKINAQWSRNLGAIGRLRVQNQLSCCGYFSPYVEATVSQTCYSRSVLPGCKKPYMDFEKRVLRTWYTAVFAIAPFHIAVTVAALLCSNHVTYRFGKGMMPKRYRLSIGSMAVIMENYAMQLVEQYGSEVASATTAFPRDQRLCKGVPANMAYLDPTGSSKTMLGGSPSSQEKRGW